MMAEPTTTELAQPAGPPVPEVPEGIRRSKAAIRRDLPELLSRRRNRGKWVCYHGDTRVGIGGYAALIEEVNRLDIPDSEFFVARIAPGAASDEEFDIGR